MQTFWNTIGDKYLSKIKKGDLEVVFSNNKVKKYGDGTYPHARIKLYNANLFKRLAFYGDIGFAESYMDKDFDCDDLTKLIKIALLNSKELSSKSEDEKKFSFYNIFPFLNKIRHFLRKNSKTRSQKNISEHYDLSNDFFKLMLDDTMMYSSAVFEHEQEDLYDAQKRKLDLLASKLQLNEGSKVLEIGSGWGAMAMHLVKEYKCDVTTLTLSKEQRSFANKDLWKKKSKNP